MIYPTDFEQKIGFSDIRRLIGQYCLSTLGKEKTDRLAFSTEADKIKEDLTRVEEFMQILAGDEEFPCQFFFDIRPALRRIRPEGLYLTEQEIFDLRRSIETLVAIVHFFRKETKEDSPYPHLYALTDDLADSRDLLRHINAILDPYGKIKDNASPELARIRTEISRTMNSISGKLNAILRQAQNEGVVEKDATPTMRDGRLVIPVAPGLKRKLRGIVHDESASGKTVFIEPTEVVEANNRIRELEGEERREIIRILLAFTSYIRPSLPSLLESYEFLAVIDFVRAVSLFSNRIEARSKASQIRPYPIIDWKNATHPLLRLSLEAHEREQKQEIVPLDITLTEKQHILIISGPNAGGKSVCLKTVGLLQYMLQCGLPIPVSENSKTGLFHSLFMDIGDEQSIENELSTYSSHLTNMKQMLRHANDRSLILIDEFGGGTEPQIGGAIAEAILKQFDEHKVYGIITTHYQNLKHFADSHPGIINGAMLYDRHLMRPLFRLSIGRPGSSFAIEIARKIGLPEQVIRDASDIVGQDYIHADKYLQDIVRDKRYWEQKRQQIHQREKEMEEAVRSYQNKLDELKNKRKDILEEAQQQAELTLKEANARIERTIRVIKENQAEREQTKEARKELEQFKATLDEHFSKTSEIPQNTGKSKAERRAEKRARQASRSTSAPSESPKGALSKPVSTGHPAPNKISVGSYVRIKGQSSIGEVSELSAKSAIVIFGSIRTQVKTDRLELSEKAPASPSQTAKTSFLSSTTQDEMYEKKLHFKPDIDVRGMRGDEALQAVTYFVDDAIQIGVSRIRILHGTGNGILRTLIRQYLSTTPSVRSYRDEHVQLGGNGITVIDLE